MTGTSAGRRGARPEVAGRRSATRPAATQPEPLKTASQIIPKLLSKIMIQKSFNYSKITK